MTSTDRARTHLGRWVEYVYSSLREVHEGVVVRDLVFLFVVVPVVLLAIEGAILSRFGPLAGINRDTLWYELARESYVSPTAVVDLYLSSFAHSEWESHLRPNLTNYIICMTALYPAAVLANRRREVMHLVLATILLTPIALKSQAVLALHGRTIGFSGILSGFFGLLAVVIFAAVDELAEVDFGPFWSLAVVLAVYVFVLTYFGAPLRALGVGVLVLAPVAAFVVMEGIEGARTVLRTLFGEENVVFPWAVFVAVGGVVGMFYGLPQATNLPGHMVGYLVGWAMAYFYLGQGVKSDWVKRNLLGRG